MHTFSIKIRFSFRTVSARMVWFQTQKAPFLTFQQFIPSLQIRSDTTLVRPMSSLKNTHLKGTFFPGEFEDE